MKYLVKIYYDLASKCFIVIIFVLQIWRTPNSLSICYFTSIGICIEKKEEIFPKWFKAWNISVAQKQALSNNLFHNIFTLVYFFL